MRRVLCKEIGVYKIKCYIRTLFYCFHYATTVINLFILFNKLRQLFHDYPLDMNLPIAISVENTPTYVFCKLAHMLLSILSYMCVLKNFFEYFTFKNRVLGTPLQGSSVQCSAEPSKGRSRTFNRRSQPVGRTKDNRVPRQPDKSLLHQ